jgi:glycosyltransferase involved in cell wall biosynthesis
LRKQGPFHSFFLGGFECSTHKRRCGQRIDVIGATKHDVFAEQDYRRLRSLGIRTCRDGIRWHLIERPGGVYDFSSFTSQLHAAMRTGTQVIWDICHYGWPDHIDIFRSEFVNRFAAFSRAVAGVIAAETDDPPVFTPINEISFFSWAAAEVGCMPPFERGRGYELKRQLVRAAVAGMEAILDVIPQARFLHVDPLIHIVTDPDASAGEKEEAEAYRRAQFQGWDMIAGYLDPELGGDPRYLDIVGGNYYVHNQWAHGGRFIERVDPRYRPLHQLLREVHGRYSRPILLAETGIEAMRRPEWFRYVCAEVETALQAGIPVQGVCLYPIVNHPGWDDDRHCHNGLWDYCNEEGEREIYSPLADEFRRQQQRISRIQTAGYGTGPRVDLHLSGSISTEEKVMTTHTNDSLAMMPNDLVCLSHLRWGFVYQRPQHLLSRFAQHHRVFFVEEPVPTDGVPRMERYTCPETGVHIMVPQIPGNLSSATQETIQKLLLNNMLMEYGIGDYILWYYTPMALSFSSHLKPRFTIFDCMDELSAFKNAPQEMKDREAEVLRRADVVFTGGQSLYEAKVGRHSDLHAFPSSIDYTHFAQARTLKVEPEDQAGIPHPRVGFAGVIDERMDIELLSALADLRPDLHFVMIGPVVTIDPATLPQRANIHYLGGKSYKELPGYLAGWDAAILPFAQNESTRFISPTKTPEYLAAGKPCVSTSITDVVRPYGVQRLVRIADTPEEFATALDAALEIDAHDANWADRRDAFLAQNSWDITYKKMRDLIESRLLTLQLKAVPPTAKFSGSNLHSAFVGD